MLHIRVILISFLLFLFTVPKSNAQRNKIETLVKYSVKKDIKTFDQESFNTGLAKLKQNHKFKRRLRKRKSYSFVIKYLELVKDKNEFTNFNKQYNSFEYEKILRNLKKYYMRYDSLLYICNHMNKSSIKKIMNSHGVCGYLDDQRRIFEGLIKKSTASLDSVQKLRDKYAYLKLDKDYLRKVDSLESERDKVLYLARESAYRQAKNIKNIIDDLIGSKLKSGKGRELPCYLRIARSKDSNELNVILMYGDSLEGRLVDGKNESKYKLDTSLCDEHLYNGSQNYKGFELGEFVEFEEEAKIVSKFLYEVFSIIANDTISDGEPVYLLDHVNINAYGGTDATPFGNQKEYDGTFGDAIHCFASVYDSEMNLTGILDNTLRKNDLLSNEFLGYLRAYGTIINFINRVDTSNIFLPSVKANIRAQKIFFVVISSRKFNVGDRFCRVEINLTGAINAALNVYEQKVAYDFIIKKEQALFEYGKQKSALKH